MLLSIILAKLRFQEFVTYSMGFCFLGRITSLTNFLARMFWLFALMFGTECLRILEIRRRRIHPNDSQWVLHWESVFGPVDLIPNPNGIDVLCTGITNRTETMLLRGRSRIHPNLKKTSILRNANRKLES